MKRKAVLRRPVALPSGEPAVHEPAVHQPAVHEPAAPTRGAKPAFDDTDHLDDLAPQQPPDRGRDDSLHWRPQVPVPSRVPVVVQDPIVEPLWDGTRVLVHFTGVREAGLPAGGTLTLTGEDGGEVFVELPDVIAQLQAAISAEDAVVDGILTAQATRSGEGAALIAETHGSVPLAMLGRRTEVDISRRPDDEEAVVGFVAVDLLRVDGQSLLDVPLLERKRLLEAVIVPSELVRVSIYTRPPIDAWVASWKAAGLRGAMLKAANSRYVPGGKSAEWRTVTQVHGRR